MAAARIIETIDILEYRALSLTAVAPNQLGFDGFEEGLNHRIVIAITFPTHRDFESILGQTALILVGTILRPAIRMVNVAYGRLSQSKGHI